MRSTVHPMASSGETGGEHAPRKLTNAPLSLLCLLWACDSGGLASHRDSPSPAPQPPRPPAALEVSCLPRTVAPGVAVIGTVSAQDAAGKAAVGYTGTVHFAS